MRISKAQRKRQRKAAARRCRELELEENLEQTKRRWISSPWPCQVCSGAEEEQFLQEKFTPLWPLDSRSDFQFIRNVVRRSFNDFLDEDNGLSLCLQELSDMEVARSTPFLLKTLNVKALQAILSLFSTRRFEKVNNRAWLESRVGRRLLGISLNGESISEILKQVVAIVRNPRSALTYVPVSVLSDLPSAPVLAAREAMARLDNLPLQTLSVMREVITGKPPSEVSLLKAKYVGNKSRHILTIQRGAARLFLQAEDSGRLPALLQRTLLVMSLSARALIGDDGELRDSVEVQNRGSEALQNQLLSAYSLIENFNLQQLEDAYLAMTQQARDDADCRHKYYDIHSRRKQESNRRHPNDYRQSIRRILFDYIIRSGVQGPPQHVRKAVVAMLSNDSQRQRSRKCRLLLWLKEQFQEEVTSVTEFASQLRDVVAGREQGFSELSDGTDTKSSDDVDWHSDDRREPECNTDLDPNREMPRTSCIEEQEVHPSVGRISVDGSQGDRSPVVNGASSDLGGPELPEEPTNVLNSQGHSSGIHSFRSVSNPSSKPFRQGRNRSMNTTSNTRRSSQEPESSHASSVAVESRPQQIEESSSSDSEDSTPLYILSQSDWRPTGDLSNCAESPKLDHDGSSPPQQQNGPTSRPKRFGTVHKVTTRERKRQRIADKAAVLTYNFIGQAMEAGRRRLGTSVPTSATKYLAGSGSQNPATEDEGASQQPSEDEMLLGLVEKLPSFSERAVKAVRRRFQAP